MAYADEIAAANRLKTLEERFAARNAVRAKYGMEPEQKTRGGIAGAYDRNKKVIGAGATALGYLFGGPAGAAVARGTMQGLDRPGEGGIGFDVGRAAKGAAEGYSAGQVANIGKAGLNRLFAPSGGTTAATTSIPTSLPTSLPSAVEGATPIGQQVAGGVGGGTGGMSQMFTPSAASSRIGTMTTAAAPAVSAAPDTPKPGMMSRLLTTVQKPEVLAPLAGGVADVLGAAQDRAAKERQVKLEERQMQLEQERQARLAQLLMPLFEQQIGRAGRTR